MRKIFLAVLIGVALLSVLLGSITTHRASATTNITVDVLVLKAKAYIDSNDPEGRTWIKATGYYVHPCGYKGRENFQMHINVDEYGPNSHHVWFTYTFPEDTTLDICVDYVGWGTYWPLGKFQAGIHTFNLDGVATSINIRKDQ